MIKPFALQRGDMVGIVSPSWGGPAVFPHRLEQGVAMLERMGYGVRLAAHARNQRGYISDSAENRAADLHELFSDPQVKAIIASIGGDHACHLLPLLDFDLIRRNPKILMGYSDISVLNIALWSAIGLITFNGPAVLTDFGEYPEMMEYTQRYFLRAVTQVNPISKIEPATEWTEEFQDWKQKKDLERPRRVQPSQGWTWLKPGMGRGPLLGGCLESLQHLRCTPYWPDWDGAIFFFETSEEKPSPGTVDGILMDYENMGVFEKLSGMLVGRPMYYTNEEKQSLREVILERTQAYQFPVISDMDFGHTAPQFTLPVGCQAVIDAATETFEILEPAVIPG